MVNYYSGIPYSMRCFHWGILTVREQDQERIEEVRLTSPGKIGSEVCHLNHHKTFCIPHGGGGSGTGHIGVKKLLASYFPSHPVVTYPLTDGVYKECIDEIYKIIHDISCCLIVYSTILNVPIGGIPAPDKIAILGLLAPLSISAAPWDSALILPIFYTFIPMLDLKGITQASKIALFNAYYMAKRFENYYAVLFR
ncbi:hypothetical protein K1719_019182 [Acacia pycnantha]|nr:hypothetical protein K1719_019182 [Acacia pycnantha]